MSFDDDTPRLVPVDQVFQSLMAKARALAASREKLDATDAARTARANAEANRIAARYEWKPSHSVAMIEEQACLCCGSVHQTFRGFGVLMKRQADGTERILATHGLDAGLRPSRYLIHSQAEACIECLPERGI
jgi:hypothetical protein